MGRPRSRRSSARSHRSWGTSKRGSPATGAFLDVGTGVGWLAHALATELPALTVTGIDVFRPALALARTNVAPLGARVTLSEHDVCALTDRDAFDAAFLAGPFVPEEIIPTAVLRIREALRPGGWLLFGLFAGAADPLSRAVTDLRVVRSGGRPW